MIDPQKVYEERSIIEWIQAIKEENLTYADLTMEDVEGCCMEEGMCLTTIIDMGERGYFSPEMLIPVVIYAGQSGYEITGKYYGEIFLRNYEKDGWHRYMKLMIPIAET